jgi:hypothetical protein
MACKSESDNLTIWKDIVTLPRTFVPNWRSYPCAVTIPTGGIITPLGIICITRQWTKKRDKRVVEQDVKLRLFAVKMKLVFGGLSVRVVVPYSPCKFFGGSFHGVQVC